MAFESFLGVLTLQVGITVLAAVFLTLAAVIFVVNMTDSFLLEGTETAPAENILSTKSIIILIFIVGLLIGGLILFLASYQESKRIALFGITTLIILTVYWIALSVVSLIGKSEHLPMVCIYNRCPESFWLANLDYRKNSVVSSKSNKVYNIPVTRKTLDIVLKMNAKYTTSRSEDFNVSKEITEEVKFKPREFTIPFEIPTFTIPFEIPTFQFPSGDWISKWGTFLPTFAPPASEPKDKGSGGWFKQIFGSSNTGGFKMGIPMIGAIALFIANAIFLIFTIICLWSYSQEVDSVYFFTDDYQYYYY